MHMAFSVASLVIFNCTLWLLTPKIYLKKYGNCTVGVIEDPTGHRDELDQLILMIIYQILNDKIKYNVNENRKN